MLTKAQAGYQFRDGTEYVCGDCSFLKNTDGCSLFAASDKISATAGVCNYFAKGPSLDLPFTGLFNKRELGYVENRVGFTCGRCDHFLVGKDGCRKVDKNSPGDTPGSISPRGCCSLWERDSRRGNLSTTALVQLLAKVPEKSSGLRTLAGIK